MQTELDKAKIFASLGSFWYSSLSKDASSQARMFSTLPLYTDIINQLSNTISNLNGKSSKKVVRHNIYKYKTSEVFITETEPGTDPVAYYPGGSSADVLYYVVPFKETLKPIAILSNTRELVIGIDFYVSNGFIWFKENPKDIFTDNKIHIVKGIDESISFLNYPLKAYDVSINTSYIADYYRNEQSPRKLKLALAAVMKLPIITEKSVLLDKKIIGTDTIYFFENEQIVVPYNHTELIVGNIYEADTIIGDPIGIYSYSNRNDTWYRNIDWSSGLSLDNITKYKGRLLPDELRTATLVEKDGSHLHVKIDIDASSSLILDSYWEEVKIREKETGNYLNNIIGFQTSDSEGATKQVNPIDVYFEGILKKKGIVIYLDNTKINDISAGIEFIKRALFFGVVPIILIELEEEVVNLLITDDGFYLRDSDNNLIEYN